MTHEKLVNLVDDLTSVTTTLASIVSTIMPTEFTEDQMELSRELINSLIKLEEYNNTDLHEWREARNEEDRIRNEIETQEKYFKDHPNE